MARLFNVEVFNAVVNGSAGTYYSDTQFHDLLGQADYLIIQPIIDSASTGVTVEVYYQSSNDPAQDGFWHELTSKATVTIAGASSVPATGTPLRTASTDINGAYGRVRVKVTTAVNGVAVRVIVCGRTQG